MLITHGILIAHHLTHPISGPCYTLTWIVFCDCVFSVTNPTTAKSLIVVLWCQLYLQGCCSRNVFDWYPSSAILLFLNQFYLLHLFATHLTKRLFCPVIDKSIGVGFIYTWQVDIFVSMSDFHIKIISLFNIIILIIYIYNFTHVRINTA